MKKNHNKKIMNNEITHIIFIIAGDDLLMLCFLNDIIFYFFKLVALFYKKNLILQYIFLKFNYEILH
jgi:hypothetical protein